MGPLRRSTRTAGDTLVFLLLLLGLLGLVAPDSAEGATPSPTVQRVEGRDRYATAAAISAARYPDGAELAFLATGETFADALSVAPGAADAGPILLTRRNVLPAATIAELERLEPDLIVVVGGPAAVGENVLQFMFDYAPQVARLAGEDRYGTSAQLAEIFAEAPLLFLASGATYPDALAGGALAAAFGAPLLLVPPTGGPTPDVQEQLCRLAPEQTYVLGGPGAISDATLASADCLGQTIRLAGQDRFATGLEVSHRNSYADTVILTTGRSFPDGLAGSAWAGARGAPMLLVEPGRIPTGVLCEIIRLEPAEVIVLGGQKAVSDGALARLDTLASSPPDCGPVDATTTRFVELGVGDTVQGIVVDEDGGSAWVAIDTGEVVEVDLDAREVVSRRDVADAPRGMAQTGDGRLVLAHAANASLTVLDPDDDSTTTVSYADALDGRDETGDEVVVVLRDGGASNGHIALVATTATSLPGSGTLVEVDLVTGEATALRRLDARAALAASGDLLVGHAATGDLLLRYEAATRELSTSPGDSVGRSLSTDREGDRLLVDGIEIVDERGSTFIDTGDQEPYGASDMSPDGTLGWIRVGTGLFGVDLATTDVVDGSYVPAAAPTTAGGGRRDLVVTDDGTRAVLGHPGGLMVVDGLGGTPSARSTSGRFLSIDAVFASRQVVSTTLPYVSLLARRS